MDVASMYPKTIIMARGNGKSTLITERICKLIAEEADFAVQQKLYHALTKGENNMTNIAKDIAQGKPVTLMTSGGAVPVQIEDIELRINEPTRFVGHFLTPAEADYIRRDMAITKAAQLAATMREIADRNRNKNRWGVPEIRNVHFSGPCTVVIWADGTKTIVRCQEGNVQDPEKGLAMAIAKKAMGTNESGSNYYDIFKQWLPKPEVEEEAPVEEVVNEEIE